jgi:copper chaperone CopZ
MNNSSNKPSKWAGYYLEDIQCQYCLYEIKKHGCSLNACCCREEIKEALENNRINRVKGAL